MNTSAVAATTQKQGSAQDPRGLLKKFQEKFPVFRDYQPLAIGIDKQLIALDASIHRKTLRLALGMHTHSFRYLKSMAVATQRFNLDGSQGGEVPEEHRKHAAEILRERAKKETERRKTEREAEALARKRAENLDLLVKKFSKER